MILGVGGGLPGDIFWWLFMKRYFLPTLPQACEGGGRLWRALVDRCLICQSPRDPSSMSLCITRSDSCCFTWEGDVETWMFSWRPTCLQGKRWQAGRLRVESWHMDNQGLGADSRADEIEEIDILEENTESRPVCANWKGPSCSRHSNWNETWI